MGAHFLKNDIGPDKPVRPQRVRESHEHNPHDGYLGKLRDTEDRVIQKDPTKNIGCYQEHDQENPDRANRIDHGTQFQHRFLQYPWFVGPSVSVSVSRRYLISHRRGHLKPSFSSSSMYAFIT